MNSEAEPVDGSRLCLACGLCCQGLLHDWARIEPHEIAGVQRLGLLAVDREGETQFALPCSRHDDNRCTVYDERPSPCRGYQCRLLRHYLTGEMSLKDALRPVEMAKRLVADVRRRLGSGNKGSSVWQQLRLFYAETPANTNPELHMDVAALLAVCQRHFRNRSQQTGVVGG